jgi:hypothetical protein
LTGFIVIAFVLPRMASSDLKAAAASLVAGAEEAKAQVGAVAEKAANLTGSGADVKIAVRVDANAGEMKYVVEHNGVIRGWNKTNAIEIVVTPVLAGGKTNWTCKGYPHDAMPQSCGGR